MQNKIVVNFQLRNSRTQKETPIEAHIRVNGKRIKYKTGIKVLPSNWNKKSTKSGREYFKPGSPKALIKHKKLREIETAARDVFDLFLLNEKLAPDPETLERLLNVELKRVEPQKKLTFFEFFEQCLERREKDMLNNGSRTTGNTTLTKYKQTRRVLREFEVFDGKRITFNSIDIDFYHRWLDWMLDDLEYKPSNVNKHIGNLKKVLNDALEVGITDNTTHTKKQFRKISEEPAFAIALSNEEIDEVFQLDLSHSPRLERVRDCFVIECCTGLRYGDVSELNHKHIIRKREKTYIQIRTQKTAKPVTLPVIDERLKYLLDKYRDSDRGFPKPYTNQEMNRELKKIGQRCEQLQKVEYYTEQKGRQRIDMEKMRWELLTTHTGRRSFATILYNKGLPPQYIMLLTAHTTEASFFKYVRITPTDFVEAFEKVMMR